MAKHVYVSNRANGFNFTVVRKLKKGKETRIRVVFEQQQFKTDDDQLASEIDELIATVPGIARNIRKADKAAAEALAIQHAEMRSRTGAHKGGVTADAAKHAMDTTLAQAELQKRDEALAKRPVDSNAFAEENLQLTEQVVAPEKPKTEANSTAVNLKIG